MMYASSGSPMYMGGGFFYDGENEWYDPAMAASMGYSDVQQTTTSTAPAPAPLPAPQPYMGEGASVTQPSYSSTPPMNVLKVGDQYWSADTVDQLQPGQWVNMNGQYQVFDPSNINVVPFDSWFQQVYGRPYAGEDPAGVLGGLRTAITQDQIDNQSGTEGFFTETLPLMAPGALIGSAIIPSITAGIDPGLNALGNGVSAADAAAGMVPQYGTNAAMDAAMGGTVAGLDPYYNTFASNTTDFGMGVDPAASDMTGDLGAFNDPYAAQIGTGTTELTPQAGDYGISNPTLTYGTDPYISGYSAASGATTGATGATGGNVGYLDTINQFLKDNPWAMPAGGALLGLLGGSSTPSQSGTTTTTQSNIPSELLPYLTGQGGLFSGAQSLLGSLTGTGGAGGTGGAVGQMQGTINGDYYLPQTWNPYGNSYTPFTSNPYIGAQTQAIGNPFLGQTSTVGSNPYLGLNNPYLESAINKTLGDVTSRVNTQFSNPNAFGGSANQEVLQRSLADASNQMRYQDYGLQAQLGESDVARRLAAQQTDLARNASLAQQLGQFNANLYQTDLARNSQLAQNQGQFNAGLYQTDLSRNSGLWNTDQSRNDQNYNMERNRQFGAASAFPDWTTSVTNSQFAPYNQYANLFRGWGGTSSQPYYTNPMGSAFGGALSGFALGSMGMKAFQ